MSNQNELSDPRAQLLLRWLRNCLRAQIGNYEAAGLFTRRNYWLGVPAVLLSAAVGTSVFAALGKNVENYPLIQMAVGAIAVLAAVLSALQTFFRWGDVASKHRAAAAEYGALKREIDELLARYAAGADVLDEDVTRVRERMDTLSRDVPELPESTWRKARASIRPAREGEAGTFKSQLPLSIKQEQE
jgi:hypothetical protein